MRPSLLAITPPGCCTPGAVPMIEAGVVEHLVAGWLRGLFLLHCHMAVLLRDPGVAPEVLLDPAGALAPLRRVLSARGVSMILSLAAEDLPRWAPRLSDENLAGVQLRGDPSLARLEQARALLGPRRILGRSCHGEPAADEPARAASADYTCLAPIFAPRTPQAGVAKQAIGVEALHRWAPTPEDAKILALGGVGLDNGAACLRAGAVGFAGISLFFGSIGSAEDNVAGLCRLLAERDLAGSAHAPPPRR